jgi:hypothetical protein
MLYVLCVLNGHNSWSKLLNQYNALGYALYHCFGSYSEKSQQRFLMAYKIRNDKLAGV